MQLNAMQYNNRRLATTCLCNRQMARQSPQARLWTSLLSCCQPLTPFTRCGVGRVDCNCSWLRTHACQSAMFCYQPTGIAVMSAHVVRPADCWRLVFAGNMLVDGIAASNFGTYHHLSAKDSEAARHAAGACQKHNSCLKEKHLNDGTMDPLGAVHSQLPLTASASHGAS